MAEHGTGKGREAILAIVVPAISGVLVAAITTYGVIAKTNTSLGRAEATAVTATAEADEAIRRLQSVGGAVPVGTVIGSMWTVAEFTSAAGDPSVFDPVRSKWAPADGRQVVGSAFHTVSNGRRLPDLRGMFLRGINDGRADALADSDTRQPGETQSWATALPRAAISLSTEGLHTHAGPNGVGHVGGGAGAHASGEHGGPAYGSSAMSAAGSHAHAVSGGDRETRPNNVSVTYFIRINR